MSREEERGTAAHEYICSDAVNSGNEYLAFGDFIKGAEWADKHPQQLWKDAENGDDFPEIEREVIVLCQPYPLENNEYTVSFAHRPDLENLGGYEPKVYGKGNWNIPNVKYWLNLDFPIKIK